MSAPSLGASAAAPEPSVLPAKRSRKHLPQFRRVFCTINVPFDTTVPDILFHGSLPVACTWCCCARHIAPTTGHVHLHAALCFVRPHTTPQVIRLLDLQADVEEMKYSPEHCREYILSKAVPGTFFEYGDMPAPGKRSDLLLLREAAVASRPIKEIIADDALCPVFARNIKFYDRLVQELAPVRDPEFQPKIFWFIGHPGSGKSYDARDLLKAKYATFYSFSNDGTGYFENYDGQKAVLFDEFNGSAGLTFSFFKQLVHPGSIQVKRRYGFRNWVAECLLFTSNNPIESSYHDSSDREPKDWRPIWRVIAGVRVYHRARPPPYTDLENFTEFERDPLDADGTRLKHAVENCRPILPVTQLLVSQ